MAKARKIQKEKDLKKLNKIKDYLASIEHFTVEGSNVSANLIDRTETKDKEIENLMSGIYDNISKAGRKLSGLRALIEDRKAEVLPKETLKGAIRYTNRIYRDYLLRKGINISGYSRMNKKDLVKLYKKIKKVTDNLRVLETS